MSTQCLALKNYKCEICGKSFEYNLQFSRTIDEKFVNLQEP